MRAIIAFFAVTLFRILRLSWRVSLSGPSPDYESGPLVFCFWHGRQAGLLAHPRPRPVSVLVSRSRDGSLQACVLKMFGFKVLRGSSSRGGAAGLKAVIEAMRGGSDCAFAVDGPHGPLFEVKPGAILAAARAKGFLVPVTVSAKRAWTFSKAWDQYQLPKPFTRVDIVRGKPIDATGADIEDLRSTLELSLKSLESEQKGDDS